MAKQVLTALLAIFLLLAALSPLRAEEAAAVYGSGPVTISLATGSPGELGLLEALAEDFNKAMYQTTKLFWIKAGSGNALQLLRDKKVDVIMVDTPGLEIVAVKMGWATGRTLLCSNEFLIVGPRNDPAKIAEAKSAVEAYRRIAKVQAKFFFRGDNSGSEKRELEIWKLAGIRPWGQWYVLTRDFMTATLKRANLEQGYFMVDSSTWTAKKGQVPNLKVLYRGDKILINTYHALCQPPGATPGAATAAKFIAFAASPQGQEIIRDYGRKHFGQALYHDAADARQFGN
jgi:tungstate transport system substrate-binding protein